MNKVNLKPSDDTVVDGTDVGMAISEEFVHHVAELPAEDGVAGQRQTHGMRPERDGAAFLMCA